MNRYDRKFMLDFLLDVTKDHTGRRHIVTWICDCGCDIAHGFFVLTRDSRSHSKHGLVIQK